MIGPQSWLRMVIQGASSEKIHLLSSLCMTFCVFLSHSAFYTMYISVRKENIDISSWFDSAIYISSRKSQIYFSAWYMRHGEIHTIFYWYMGVGLPFYIWCWVCAVWSKLFRFLSNDMLPVETLRLGVLN